MAQHIHTARFHTGDFFLIQDEHATTGPNGPFPFHTISVMGVDPSTDSYFAHTFKNHGFFGCTKSPSTGWCGR